MIAAISVIVLAPELLPAYLGREGQIWTPFNSSNYRLGDMYYYASMIPQVVDGNIPPFPANQLADGPDSSPEQLRWLGYLVAATPAFLTSDPRIPLLWATTLPSVLNFLLAFAIFRSLQGKFVPALMAGLLATFYFQFWRAIPPGPETISLAGIGDWLSLSSRRLEGALGNAKAPYDYYSYSDMFRFLMPAMSFAFLSGFLAITLKVDRHRRVFISFVATVAACLMAFSYPPHTVFSYLLISAFAAVNLWARDWRGFSHFFCIGVVTLVFLFVARIPQKFLTGFDEATFISAVYGVNGGMFADVALSDLPVALVSKYSVSFCIVLWIAWGNALLRRFVLVTGSVVVIMSLAAVLPDLYANRILYRGIDHIWFLVLVSVVFRCLQKKSENGSRPSGSAIRKKLSHARTPLALAGLMILPIVGFSSLLERNLTDPRRFIPEGQWSAYTWLEENAQGETVAALNWDDIEFIAVYLAQTRTIFGSADLANRRPESEVARFVATWKAFGLSRATFEDWVRRSLETELDRRKSIGSQRSTPLLSTDDYASSRIALALIYFPFVREFDGTPIAGEGRDQWSINEAFIDKLLAVFDQTPVDGFVEKQGVRTLIVSPFEEELLPDDVLANWQLVWQSPERKIYRRIPTSGS